MKSFYVASTVSRRKVAWLALLVTCVAAVLLTTRPGRAQAPAAKGIDDTWQGTLHLPQRDLRIVLKMSRGADGALTGALYSIDQGGQSIKTSSAGFVDGTMKIAVQAMDMTYEGKLSTDGKSIAGTFTQGSQPTPLVFERATPETAWVIPEAPKPIPPMSADAKPVFEVATIKPSAPDEQGHYFIVRGGQFVTANTTLLDLIKFAYGVQESRFPTCPIGPRARSSTLPGNRT